MKKRVDFELDSLPQKVADGRLSKEAAAMKVFEVLYTNPARFNLSDMEEDERSDFLLGVLPKLEGILARYDKSLGPLGAYIYYSLPGMRLSWAKRRIDALTVEKAVATSVKSIYEDAMECKRVTVSDAEPCARRPREDDSPLVFKRIFNQPMGLSKPRDYACKRRSAFVLALKSAWYIDDKSVEKISDYCGCASDDLSSALAQVKRTLLKKNEKRAALERLRDKAWFFVCKYRERLLTLEPHTMAWEATKRKLDYQLASWKNKTRLLQSCRMNVTPNNNELAKLLCVKPYRISDYLTYARRMANAGEKFWAAESGD